MATDQEILAKEAKLKKFMADLNCLCERHNLIINKEIRPAHLRVFEKSDGREIGKIQYNEKQDKYQEYLSPTQKEIRKEVKEEISKEILNIVDKLQNQFLEKVVGKNPKIITDEEELIYWTALDKIEDKFEDYKL